MADTWPAFALLVDPRPAAEIDRKAYQLNAHHVAKTCWRCGAKLQAEGVGVTFYYDDKTWDKQLMRLDELTQLLNTSWEDCSRQNRSRQISRASSPQ